MVSSKTIAHPPNFSRPQFFLYSPPPLLTLYATHWYLMYLHNTQQYGMLTGDDGAQQAKYDHPYDVHLCPIKVPCFVMGHPPLILIQCILHIGHDSCQSQRWEQCVIKFVITHQDPNSNKTTSIPYTHPMCMLPTINIPYVHHWPSLSIIMFYKILYFVLISSLSNNSSITPTTPQANRMYTLIMYCNV